MTAGLPRILLTNDDGVESPSLWALAEVLKDIARPEVVAPTKPRSASGHGVTLYGGIAVRKISLPDGRRGYGVDGTPADAVKFALCELFRGERFDLIVSGINLGPNTGVSVYYSGTVAAAREAVIAGIPAFAISIAAFQWQDFGFASGLAKRLAEAYLSGSLPRDYFLNVNVPGVPHEEIRGIRVTRQAPSRFEEKFERVLEGEEEHYRLKGEMRVLSRDGGTDQEALEEKWVSITPLALDLTHYPYWETTQGLADWLGRNQDGRNGGGP